MPKELLMDHPPSSLNGWQDYFMVLYGWNNSNRSPEQVLLKVVEHSAAVADALRKGNGPVARQSLAHAFAWLCGFSTRVGLSVSLVLWDRYPNVCPYCRKKICSLEQAEHEVVDEAMLGLVRSPRDQSVSSLEDWASMLQRIYGEANKPRKTSELGFHYLEEVGEVAKELLAGNRLGIAAEVADVIAWMHALVHRINTEHQSMPMKQALWDVYRSGCPYCHSVPCAVWCTGKVNELVER